MFNIYRGKILIAKVLHRDSAVRVAVALQGRIYDSYLNVIKWGGRIVWKYPSDIDFKQQVDYQQEADNIKNRIFENHADSDLRRKRQHEKWLATEDGKKHTAAEKRAAEFDDARVGRINTLNNPICRLHGNSNCNHCDI